MAATLAVVVGVALGGRGGATDASATAGGEVAVGVDPATPEPAGPNESDAGALAPRATGAPLAAALGVDDRALLRTVFGIDDPARLYVSEDAGVLVYAATPPGCRAAAGPVGEPARRGCRRVAVRVGLAAPRRPGETWDAFVARVARSGARAWPEGARAYYTGLVSLAPEARPAFERLVADARRAGFRVRVAETYRSPERQALLLARTDGRTSTATSVHSYGRAADLVVGDGRIDREATAREWIRFRRWVVAYRGGEFRLVGTPSRTWDWPHVELAAPVLGFRTVPSLVQRARACRDEAQDAAEAAVRCTIVPNLPAHLSSHAVSPPARVGD